MNLMNRVVYIIKAKIVDIADICKYHSLGLDSVEGFDSWSRLRKNTYATGRSVLQSFCQKEGFLLKDQHVCHFIEKSEHGKPFFRIPKNIELPIPYKNKKLETLHFNISHSGDYLYLAVSEYPIGIDIERIKPRKGFEGIKKKVLSQNECSYIESTEASEDATVRANTEAKVNTSATVSTEATAPNLDLAMAKQLEKFFYLWTIKESLVKTTGTGLVGLDSFDFTQDPKIAVITHIPKHSEDKIIGVVVTHLIGNVDKIDKEINNTVIQATASLHTSANTNYNDNDQISISSPKTINSNTCSSNIGGYILSYYIHNLEQDKIKYLNYDARVGGFTEDEALDIVKLTCII